MAIHFNVDVTIEEILAHPRYREFARACTEEGGRWSRTVSPGTAWAKVTRRFWRCPCALRVGPAAEPGWLF
jgi:hypothetical protein